MQIKRTIGEVLFDLLNNVIMFLVLIACLYPLWYVTIASFSDVDAVAMGKVILLPKGMNFSAYEQVFNTKNFWTSYGNTIFYSIAGTLLSMFLSTTGAYALSKKYMVGHKFFTWFVLLSMWFGAGLMPTYLNFKNLGLLDSRAAILLCGAISTFNVILIRTYFESIPTDLEESAKLDGANDIYIFSKIYVPLSIPVIMTVTLYYFVGRWNSYFWTMLLIQTESKISLQVLLKKLVVEMNVNYSQAAGIDFQSSSRETMMYATMVVAVLPMLMIYPFIQKYFVKGIMVGAIKG